jgi:hypothetical protein
VALDPPVAGTGTIPFRIWVGVTGHRDITDDERLRALVRDALDEIGALVPGSRHTEVVLGVISPLAEGADRLVVDEVLRRPDGVLEVPLPLSQADYMTDFASQSSKQEFQALLARAANVTELPATGNRDEAYARAGDEVIDRCDVLLAVWDGEKARGEGGTAEVVDRAAELIPVVWVPSTGEGPVRWMGQPFHPSAYAALDRFNRESIGTDRFADEVERQSGSLLGDTEDPDRLSLGRFVDWVVPYLVRADQVALRYQRRFRWGFALVTVLALLTVGAVACGAAFATTSTDAAKVEFGLLLVVGMTVLLGRRAHLHDRWISSRFLAERLRSACVLAVAGIRRRPGDLERGTPGRRAELEWVGRAFTEVWQHRPSEAGEPPLANLRDYVITAWIDDQRAYHERASRRYERNHRVVEFAVIGLFLMTAIAAFLHGSHALGEDTTLQEWLLFAAIFLPGLAGAFGAWEIDGEYRRNAERYAETARRLTESGRVLRSAGDLAAVQARVVEIEELMDRENRDWFALMKFHDFEPPV